MLKDFIPQTFLCLKEGYSKKTFFDDLFAGFTIGMIALPLALAFAIGAGVEPEQGLFTAIIAGFLIALLGGSRFQISGPTGAFVVIIYSIVQRHGYEGLAIATLLAGIMIVLLGLARGGVLLKFIPFPVITGFTTGIALVIFISQIKDFLGLNLNSPPPEFLQKCKAYCLYAHTWNPWAFSLSLGSLILIFCMRHFFPKLPGVILVVTGATTLAYFFQFPVETIKDQFGELPRSLPWPHLPTFSYQKMIDVFPDAISIALLGAIESLLSALVADGMTGQRHRSNSELVAQGAGNIASVFFGGIPATGAIARTAANIKLGGKTPIAGMIHACTLVVLMLFFAPWAGLIPLCVLSAVLIYVAWNMSEISHFVEILKNRNAETLVLMITFLLTVLVDLTVAVQIGVILAALLFVKNMKDTTKITEHNSSLIPDHIRIFEIKGPFFYATSELLENTLVLENGPRYFILRFHDVPLIDITGLKALKMFTIKCKQKGTTVLLSGFNTYLMEHNFDKKHLFTDVEQALDYARNEDS